LGVNGFLNCDETCPIEKIETKTYFVISAFLAVRTEAEV
jgi:hypothetical protein